MALTIPNLDDRTYAALLQAAGEAIPVHSEEWTDHNVHDPGITILELLAWVAESDIYQLNRLTDEHRRKYLQLLGVTPNPPEPASASLALTLPERTRAATIPAGQPLEVDEPGGEPQYFQTAAPVTLTEASLVRVVSEHSDGRSDNTTANETPGVPFLAFGADARPGSAMYLGFDADPFAAVGTLDLTVAFHETDLPAPASHGAEPSAFDPSVEVVWEYCTDYSRWYLSAVWREFDVRHDGTNRLYQSGTVRLDRPGEWSGRRATTADGVLDQETPLVWLRCRLAWTDGGVGHEVPPQFDAVTVNTVRARHRLDVEDEVLRRPDGGAETTAWPGQTFRFERAPVLATDAEEDVDVVVGVGDPRGVLDVPWTQVPDFDASGPDDRHFVLDHATGEIQFGDGVRGTVPEPGRRVLARSASHGGGTAGNVSASATWRFSAAEVDRTGVYRYYSASDRETMRGAIIVANAADDDVADWLDGVDADDTPVDERGRREVVVEVGSETADGSPAFSPPVVRIDPGAVVRFVWRSGLHTVHVEDQPPDGDWEGHPAAETAGFEYSRTFEASLDPTKVGVRPRGRATGGRDAESVDAALTRLREDLRTPYRAVTAADWATLATTTPGLRFGRATAVVEPGAVRRDCERHSTVRVIVVPFSPRDRPVPTAGFLDAVQCHLERHRLVTDRVTVRPPTYVGIGVDVEMRIRSGYAATERAAAVDARLREFLHPLTGFEGDGWPFGRPVYLSELYEVVEAVEGVDCVLNVDVAATGPTATQRDGTVEIGRSALVYPTDHSVVVRPDRDDCGVGGVT